MVYFVQGIGGGSIKIGNTIQLSFRLKQLAKDHGREFRVLAVVPGRYAEENALHQRFSHIRVVDEFFLPSDELLGYIAEFGQEWDGTDESRMVPLKVDADILRDSRIVCAITGEDIQDYVSRALAPIVARHKEEAMALEREKMSDQPRVKKPER